MSYDILLVIQYISVFFLLLESLYVFQRLRGRLHSFLFLYVFATLINNSGYLMEMVAVNSQAALIATKLRNELEEMYITENESNSSIGAW